MTEVVFGIDASSQTVYGDAVGFVYFGGWSEEFGVSLRYWSCDEYLSQWRRALSSVAHGKQDTLIASIDDPQDDGSIVRTWPFYHAEGRVFMRNKLLVLPSHDRCFEPEDVNSWIEPRAPSPDGPVSEWSLPAHQFSWAVGVARLWRRP